jgi:hypothetical protein
MIHNPLESTIRLSESGWLKLTPKKPKDAGLFISVPFELARDIFSESGDLRSEKFPAIMILADTIGKALPPTHEDTKKRPKPTVITKTRKSRAVHHRKPFELPFITR